MNRIVLLLTFILAGLTANAQQYKISGIVKDQQLLPVDRCNVLLCHKDSSSVKGTITDSTGHFQIDALPGEYFIRVSMVGYTQTETPLFTITEGQGATIKMADILLGYSVNAMAEVTVTTTKKLFEMQPDKMVMNVENSVLATGNSLFEVLRKAPMVTTDKDDNIMLKGAVSQIFIDGKPAYLGGLQLTEYLKSLPADVVSKIEIITNPSSKYEAAGATGIINIKLKKNKGNGLNGTANLSSGFGKYGKVNGGFNVNYRKDKLNIFANAYSGYSESFNELTYNSKINNNGVVSLQDRYNYWNPKDKYAGYKAGIDYSVSKNSTVGILYRGNFDHTDAQTDNTSIFNDGKNSSSESLVKSTRNETARSYNHFFNLNYKLLLDTSGGELSIDADYANYTKNSTDINENHFYQTPGQESRSPYLFRNIQPANAVVKAVKADYSHVFKNKISMEAGFKLSNVKSDNELIADSLHNMEWQKDVSRTNHFVYNENISAAYLSFSKTINNTSIQAGLRAEKTNSEGHSITLGKTDKRNYLDFFPTLFISQKINQDHQLNFSYSRRISRPGYESLNPFVMYLDPYTYFEGNPYLRPTYSNNLEIKHSYKDMLFTTLSYNHSTDEQTQVIRQNKATGVTDNTMENADYSNYLRLDIMSSLPITKWWSSEETMSLSYNREFSSIPDYSFATKAISADFGTNNTFILPKKYKVQTSFYYSIPTTTGIAKVRSDYRWDLGVQKQFWKDKATLKLNASNIIGPSAYRAHYISSDLDILWKNKWEGRRLTLSFVYKFGSSTIKANRSHSTAAQQELDRI
jgi:hypothetical protein